MASFISSFITVGICLAIYAYIKKKYAVQIAALQEQIDNLNLDVVKHKTHIKQLDDKVFVAEKDLSSYKSRLETMIDINKELNAKYQSVTPVTLRTEVNSSTPVNTTTADGPSKITESSRNKRGRKPGSKKPFFGNARTKKKSDGNPS
jgi:cell division protein FtsB